MNNPKKWTELYPQGSKSGDEESKFFCALARNQKFTYLSIPQLVKETGLPRERVEEIINKYSNKIKPPLVYQHPTNQDSWGYWERNPEVLQKDDRSISEKDQDGRINKHIGSSCETSCNCGSCNPDPKANSTASFNNCTVGTTSTSVPIVIIDVIAT